MCAGIADFIPAFLPYSFAVSKLLAIFKQRHNEHKIAKSAHDLRFLEVQLHKVQVNAFWYKWLITLQKSGTSLLFYWSFMSTLISQKVPWVLSTSSDKAWAPLFAFLNYWCHLNFSFLRAFVFFLFSVCVRAYLLFVWVRTFSTASDRNSHLPNQKENL